MTKTSLSFFSLSVFCLFSISSFAQSYTNTTPVPKDTITPTWNDVRIINSPTTKTAPPHFLDVYFMHRFGNMGEASNGGAHSLYGFDVASDIVVGFDLGLSKRLMVGFSRSKQQEMLDFYGKYKILYQKKGGSPFSMAISEDIGFIPQDTSTFYKGSNIPTSRRNFYDRFDYLTQLIIDTRINKHISLEIIPTLCHRNHVIETSNSNNGAFDANDIPAIGAGGRYMITKQLGIVADYYYIISKFRMNNPDQAYYNSLSLGIEVFTGGHVFEINLSNASGLLGNTLIPSTTDTWTKGGFKLGFTIMRAFGV